MATKKAFHVGDTVRILDGDVLGVIERDMSDDDHEWYAATPKYPHPYLIRAYGGPSAFEYVSSRKHIDYMR